MSNFLKWSQLKIFFQVMSGFLQFDDCTLYTTLCFCLCNTLLTEQLEIIDEG